MLEDSLDPVIQRIVARRGELLAEMARTRAMLGIYMQQQRAPELERAPISPLEHYSMLDAPDCGCATCLEWEQRRAEFVSVVALVPPKHKWTICACPICRFVGRIQLNWLAAQNRRDLLIEMSFHARYHSHHGVEIMAWLKEEMKNPAYTVNWCAQEMTRFPMERWIRKCETAVSGIVSGAVFIDSSGVTHYEARLGSSLIAETQVGTGYGGEV
jgi:hypothetical protein